MDIMRHLRYLQSSPEVRMGTLKIEIGEAGEITYRPIVGGQVFTRFSDAQTYVRDALKLTEANVYTSGQPMFGGPTFVRHLARDIQMHYPGAEVQRLSFNLKNTKELNAFRELYEPEKGKFFGWAVQDNEKAILTRVLLPGEEGARRAMSSDDLFDFIRRTTGLDQAFLEPKYGKRAKTFTTSKMYEMMTTDPIKVGLYDAGKGMQLGDYEKEVRKLVNEDPKYFASIKKEAGKPAMSREQAIKYEMRKAADMAVDGFSEGSIGLFESMRDFHREYLDDLDDMLRKRLGANVDEADIFRIASRSSDPKILQLYREREMISKNIDQLQNILDRGTGIFNLRATGLEGMALPGHDFNPQVNKVLAEMQQKGFQIKGNIILNSSEAFQNLGVHIRTHYDNIKFEAGLLPTAIDSKLVEDITEKLFQTTGQQIRRGTSYVTLSHLNEAMDTIVDLQTAHSYPEFYSKEILREGGDELLERFGQMIEATRLPGGAEDRMRLLGPYIDILESQMTSPDERIANAAREIKTFLDAGGTLADDPYLMEKVIDNLSSSLVREKGGVKLPKIRIPGSIRAEVKPKSIMELGGEHKPGYIRFDPKAQAWIVHEMDSQKTYHAWGGFDYDDAVNGIIRYDKDNRRIKVLMTRQPNARGEWAFFDMYQDDAAVHRVLRDTIGYEEYKINVKAYRKLKERERKLSKRSDTPVHSPHFRADLFRRSDLERVRVDLRQIENNIDRILGENLKDVGEIPWRRGFDEHGNYLGYRKIWDADQRRYRFYGEESANLAYQVLEEGKKPSREAAEAIKQRLHTMTSQQRIDAYAGVLARLDDIIGVEGGDPTGTWSNARMFYDQWYATHEKAIRNDPVLQRKVAAIARNMLEQEAVIDAYAQGLAGKATLPGGKTIQRLTSEMIEGVVEAAALGISRGRDTRIDPLSMEAKALDNRAIAEGLRKANAEIRKRLGPNADLDTIMEALVTTDPSAPASRRLVMEASDPRANINVLREIADEIETAKKTYLEAISYPQWMMDMDVRASRSATRDAMAIISAEKRIREDLSRYLAPGDALGRTELRAGQGIGIMSKREFHHQVSEELVEYVSQNLFDEGQAGERTYRAIVRAAQIVDASEHRSFGVLGNLGSLYHDALAWGQGKDVVHQTLEDIHRRHSSLTREALRDVMEDILRGTDISMDAIEDMQRGVSAAQRRGINQVPAAYDRAFRGQQGPSIQPFYGQELRGPLDPSAIVRLPGEEDQITTLGRMLFDYGEAAEPERRAIAGQVRQMMGGYRDVMSEWALDRKERMPKVLWEETTRSFDSQKAAEAKQLAEEVGQFKFSKGFRNLFRDVAGTTFGRWGIGGSIAALAAAIIHTRRKKDHTINDMQGPAFLPGGNPYEDNIPIPRNMEGAASPYAPASGGVTYEIRTRGGNYDRDFLNEVSTATGGSVTGSVYDAPLQSGRTRDEILRMYR